MKRSIALALSLMMLFTLMVTGVSAEEERPTISYYAYWCGALDPGSYVETFVEDHLNMNIEVRKVSHTDKEAVNLMLASGEMPDCGWFEHTYAQMEDEELIRSIPVEMVREYAPGYIDLCDRYPILYTQGLDPEDPTQFRFLPDFCIGQINTHNNAMYLRYDWIKKLGIDLGVNVEQLTDQLYIADNGLSREVFIDVLRGFVYDDPDGNGENDTFGLLKDWAVSLVTSQGILYGGNMDVDGQPLDWFVNPGMKDLLLYVQELYAEGLIYPEIFTLQWGEDWELITNGKAGVLSGNAVATIWLNSWAKNRPPLALFDADPEAELLMIPGIAGPDGQVHHAKPYLPGRGESFYVNADVDDEKLADILTFFNFCNFPGDDDIIATLWCGEKGVDWEWNEDGTPNRITNIQNGERGTQVFCRNIQDGKAYEWYTYEPLFSTGLKYYVEEYGGIWNKMLEYPYKADIFNETDAAEIQMGYSKDWEAARNSYFMSVILGEANVEEDWDAYIETLNSLKYGEYVEEMSKAPTIDEIINMYSE